ncbi:hypothetical protein ACH4UM_37935 [Streptomyces sp. NPDC020801]|uniref:hypothetical protein n=1 Tax=Streptomyces sp. NPDC020801 TaxID=3365093 RepID=UPI0037B425E4
MESGEEFREVLASALFLVGCCYGVLDETGKLLFEFGRSEGLQLMRFLVLLSLP